MWICKWFMWFVKNSITFCSNIFTLMIHTTNSYVNNNWFTFILINRSNLYSDTQLHLYSVIRMIFSLTNRNLVGMYALCRTRAFCEPKAFVRDESFYGKLANLILASAKFISGFSIPCKLNLATRSMYVLEARAWLSTVLNFPGL